MSELPPGFVIDDAPTQPAPAQVASPQATGLPDGFVLDDGGASPSEAPKSSGGFHWPSLSSVFNGVTSGASEAGKQMVDAAVSGFTAPRDAWRGDLQTMPSQMTHEDASRVLDLMQFANPVSPATGSALVPLKVATGAAKDAADFGIALTAGQKTADPVLLSTEDAMYGGAQGDAAQRVAQQARGIQREQVAAAKDAIGETAGRGQADIGIPADAGQATIEAVQQAAAQAKAATNQKYKDAFAHDGYMDPRVFTGERPPTTPPIAPGTSLPGPAADPSPFARPISERITQGLLDHPDPVMIDPQTTPLAHAALGTLDKIDNLRLGSIGQPGADDAVVGINLRGVDQARRRLQASYNTAAPGTPDRAVMRRIIGEFDGQVQSAMENGMFSGDEDALAALKDARASHASYMRTFKPQGAGDDVGQAMRAIMERNATPEQVARYLYSGVKVGSSPLSVRLADRLKPLLGEDSPEWSGIRQGAWQKVVGGADTGSAVAAKRIQDFVQGEGRSLSTRLFNDNERQEMLKLANVLKAISSKPGTINPSNSGNRLAALARKSFGTIMSSLGAQVGGVPGAIAGYTGGKGIEAIGNAMNAGRARQLFQGDAPMTVGRRLQQAGAGVQQVTAPGALQLSVRPYLLPAPQAAQ